ncbi:hypothetical protein VW29_09995 [Devosia limi DSM 17137]|uniref:HMA domain-containing protein n=2 Tax=Devosia limi DSM 17137 TaxID=1121477 RepID=A0A0F5LRD8_9HYPH|nr:hypothetical protein VW29_09995 [Devosia limi DSM 17137]
MTCAHCVATVERAVKSVDGAAKVDIDLGALAVKSVDGAAKVDIDLGALAVKSVDGAAKVDIDLGALAVKIESDKPVERFAKAIEDAGYTGELRA